MWNKHVIYVAPFVQVCSSLKFPDLRFDTFLPVASVMDILFEGSQKVESFLCIFFVFTSVINILFG